MIMILIIESSNPDSLYAWGRGRVRKARLRAWQARPMLRVPSEVQ